jgi:DNA polymerase III subunit delta
MAKIPSIQQIQAQDVAPVYFIFGEEDLLVEQLMDNFRQHLVDPSMVEFNRDLFYGEDLKDIEIFRLAESFPMMVEKRLIIVRGIEKAPARVMQHLNDYLESPCPSSCLILCAGKVDMRKKVFKTLRKKTEAIEFKALSIDELPGWMIGYCKTQNRILSRKLSSILAEQLFGGGLRFISAELDKLILLNPADDQETEITEDEVACALGVDRQGSPYHLLDAILFRDTRKSLSILRSLMRGTGSAWTVLPTLHRGFGRLWFMLRLREQGQRDDSIATILGLKSWQVRSAMSPAGKWSVNNIEKAVELLLDADFALKGASQLSNEQQFTILVHQLCQI